MMQELSISEHYKQLKSRFFQKRNLLILPEILELSLALAVPKRDMKPVAKLLLKQFGTLKGVIQATEKELRAIEGMNEAVILHLKLLESIFEKVLEEQCLDKPFCGSLKEVLQYCQATMGHLRKEQFRILFLDRRNYLICDEVLQQGTIDQVAVYPREILHHAFERGASALILAHNHPSGDPAPSMADIEITRRIQDVLRPVSIELHDHLIIARDKHTSFKLNGLL